MSLYRRFLAVLLVSFVLGIQAASLPPSNTFKTTSDDTSTVPLPVASDVTSTVTVPVVVPSEMTQTESDDTSTVPDPVVPSEMTKTESDDTSTPHPVVVPSETSTSGTDDTSKACLPYLRKPDGTPMEADVSTFYSSYPSCLGGLLSSMFGSGRRILETAVLDQEEDVNLCGQFLDLLSLIDAKGLTQGMCDARVLADSSDKDFCSGMYVSQKKEISDLPGKLEELGHRELAVTASKVSQVEEKCEVVCGKIFKSVLCVGFVRAGLWFVSNQQSETPAPPTDSAEKLLKMLGNDEMAERLLKLLNKETRAPPTDSTEKLLKLLGNGEMAERLIKLLKGTEKDTPSTTTTNAPATQPTASTTTSPPSKPSTSSEAIKTGTSGSSSVEGVQKEGNSPLGATDSPPLQPIASDTPSSEAPTLAAVGRVPGTQTDIPEKSVLVKNDVDVSSTKTESDDSPDESPEPDVGGQIVKLDKEVQTEEGILEKLKDEELEIEDEGGSEEELELVEQEIKEEEELVGELEEEEVELINEKISEVVEDVEGLEKKVEELKKGEASPDKLEKVKQKIEDEEVLIDDLEEKEERLEQEVEGIEEDLGDRLEVDELLAKTQGDDKTLPPPVTGTEGTKKPAMLGEIYGVATEKTKPHSPSGYSSWHFFTLFLLVAILAIVGYLCVHNRKKLRDGVTNYMSDSRKRRRGREYKPLLTAKT